ncbi:hypothetical protein NDU88_009803 [Pleurodeles waltl]|uniref:Uncharacterized protein n=1 Tax=Pleurodeles waltl TaxID=8319 RepID=A0AAV7QYJ8_PLEWA|nr:hypothetical protein NDU88_009803 [Pleurodeles waltl]
MSRSLVPLEGVAGAGSLEGRRQAGCVVYGTWGHGILPFRILDWLKLGNTDIDMPLASPELEPEAGEATRRARLHSQLSNFPVES